MRGNIVCVKSAAELNFFCMPASGLLTPDLISLTNCSTDELILALHVLSKSSTASKDGARLDFACELHTAGGAFDVKASSGVSSGGGLGAAGVETRGSDVVEVTSATLLRAFTGVPDVNAKIDALSHYACHDTVLNIVLVPKVWRHPHIRSCRQSGPSVVE